MTKQLIIVIALVGMGTLIFAGSPKPADKTEKTKEELLNGKLDTLHKEMFKELKLTKKQDAPVRKILATHRHDMIEWLRTNEPEMEKLQQRIMSAHKGTNTESPEKARAAATKFRKLQDDQDKLAKDLINRLKGALDKTQLAKVKNMLDPAPKVKKSFPFHL